MSQLWISSCETNAIFSVEETAEKSDPIKYCYAWPLDSSLGIGIRTALYKIKAVAE